MYVLNYCCYTHAGITQFCDPSYTIEVPGYSNPIPITAPNGMCSYGIGNVGTYTSIFTSTDIVDQVFDNPAGRFDYDELIEQAMDQTYVLTDLFDNNPDLPMSLFSIFLPNTTMPTTDFLSDPAPTDPNSSGSGASVLLPGSLVIMLAYSIVNLALLL